MDIFFADSNEVPLPPDEVHIRALTAEPWPDGRRVRVTLQVSAFQKRPSSDITITDAEGKTVATANIIETINPNLEFNLHLRSDDTSGEYSVSAVLFYLEEIDLEELEEGDFQDEKGQPIRPERTEVDRAETTFVIAGNSEN